MNHGNQGTFSDQELAAFLDEALDPGRSSAVERAARTDPTLRDRLRTIRDRENAGLHTIGAIWRRSGLSCPGRTELAQFLLGTLDPEPAAYVRHHLEQVGCRFCQANLDDLKAAAADDGRPPRRRRRFFETSAGYLRPRK